jgi:uncharacterized membrane protein YhaH (DUF805 family)
MEWYLEALKKYAVFSGRSRRKEYWFFVLFNFLIGIAFGIVDAVVGLGFLGLIYGLAVIIPGIAVTIRRLHDTGRSGWWILIGFVPIIGFFVMLYFLFQDSEPGANEYGPNPKQSEFTSGQPNIAMS